MLFYSGITYWPVNREGGLSEAHTVQMQGERFKNRQFTFCSLGGGQVRGAVWHTLTWQGWWQEGWTSSELPSSCRYEQAIN